MESQREKSSYGPGTFVDGSFSPLPQECKRLLHGLAARTPGFTKESALIDGVRFEGSDLPCIPGPIKSQAFTAALHAMVGIVGHEILELKGIETNKQTIIHTDQAALYLATPALVTVDGVDGPAVLKLPTVPDFDKGVLDSYVKFRSEAIYETKTPGVWYQMHGSTGPEEVLRVIGVDPETKFATHNQAYLHINEHMKAYSDRELEMMMLEKGFAGSIVHSPEGWMNTLMGKSLQRHPLINCQRQTQTGELKPVGLPRAKAGDMRPLAGVRVVELARIIAAPGCGAILSSMGAEVIRIQSGDMMDLSALQLTLTAGKKTYDLDLSNPANHKVMEQLVSTADVILQGYRLRSLERHGFGLQHCLDLANRRGKGIIYLDENCYGPDGYYAERPGWQQVADAAAGSSYVMGKAYGCPDGQGVLPSLPISDLATGVVSAVAVMGMLRDRTRVGGSWHGTASLAAYNAATLEEWVGLYQPEIVKKIQANYHFPSMNSEHHVIELFFMVYEAWNKAGKEGRNLTKEEGYYTYFRNSVFGKNLRILAPMVRYDDPEMSPRWTSPPVPFCHHKGDPEWEHVKTASSGLLDQEGDPTIYFLDIDLSHTPDEAFNMGRVVVGHPNGTQARTLVDHQHLPDGLAFSKVTDKLYWTSRGVPSQDDGSIWSCNRDGSDARMILPKGTVHTPKQLCIDDENHKIYVSDREGMQVMRCNLDGSAPETLVQAGERSRHSDAVDQTRWCVGIAVVPSEGKFYWTQKGPSKGNQGRIFRANIKMPAGSTYRNRNDLECLYQDLPEPIDLDIDAEARLLYWTDRGEIPRGNSLNRAALDNLNARSDAKITILARNLHEAIGLHVDKVNQRIYTTDLGGCVYVFDMEGKIIKKMYEDQGALSGITVWN